MNRLYLVRHGENLANLTKEFSCRSVDYPLTPKGVLQAQQTAEHLAGKDIHEVYTSPLRRAAETAGIIAARLGLQAVAMENWREIDVGELEGRPVTRELWEHFHRVLGAWLDGRHDLGFPGGEDYWGLLARMRGGVEEVVRGKQRRNIVIVGHGGIFTLTLKDICPGVDLDWLRQARSQNCSISELLVELRQGGLWGQLVSWASHDHLSGDAADLIPGGPTDDTFRG